MSEKKESGGASEERAKIELPAEGVFVEIVFPEQTNHYGTLFGGEALALMDKAAFVAATRYTRLTMVTRSSKEVEFRVPVKQGQLVELSARVVETGRTSLCVDVDMYCEELLSGERKLATSGSFVFVALDENGEPTEVQPLDGGDPLPQDSCRLG